MENKLQLLVITCIALAASPVLASNDLGAFNCSITDESCEVPYNSSMMVLYCPGGNQVVKWRHTLHNQNVSICSKAIDRNCKVRGYQGRLSNDDSGYYYCVESETVSKKVNVTILAPPQLTNIFNYPNICTPPVWRNSCKTSPILYVNQNVDLTVTYNSTGPVTVRWFVNDSVVNCPSAYNETINHHCIGIYTSSTKSTITLVPIPGDKYSLDGIYKAEVSNAYGSNSSVTNVTQDCSKSPKDVTNDDVYFNITVGETVPEALSRACRTGYESNSRPKQNLCFTNNPDTTFEEALADYPNCARCTETCYAQFTNNDHFYVKASWETCPSVLNLAIQSRENTTVSRNDSGKIFCFYGRNELYTTVHITVVDRPPPNLHSLEIYIPAGGVVLLIVALLIIIVVLGYKYRARRKEPSRKRLQRQKIEAEREKLLVQDKGRARVSPITVSSNRRPSKRGAYNTFPNVPPDSDIGGLTEVQSDLPDEYDLPVQTNQKEEYIIS